MARSIGVMYGTWNLYKQIEETGSFYDKYEVEEFSDMTFPIQVILWDDVLNELDAITHDYTEYPEEWKKIDGVAVLESCHALYEIDEELTNLQLVSIDNVNLNVYDVVYDDPEWDMQEAEEAIDIQSGKQIDLWAE